MHYLIIKEKFAIDVYKRQDQVSMVLQKNVLFTGTIYDNIRWGDENASDEEVQRMCKLAQADGFVNEFPAGYNTQIVQGGNNVSGGQKQRLCIARALLKKPKILILDDSTSAVDTKTDASVSYTHLDVYKRQAVPDLCIQTEQRVRRDYETKGKWKPFDLDGIDVCLVFLCDLRGGSFTGICKVT